MGLLSQRQSRLDEERVGKQRSERPEVGGAIEDIGVLRVLEPGASEPSLHERRGRRDGKEGKPHRGGEQADQPDILPAGRGLVEGRRDRDRQRQEGDREKAEVDRGGSDKVKVTRYNMRIKRAKKQHCLEERDRNRPDRSRSAESRQNHLREHRLDPEQERCREKQCYRENQLYRFAVHDRVEQWGPPGNQFAPKPDRELAR